MDARKKEQGERTNARFLHTDESGTQVLPCEQETEAQEGRRAGQEDQRLPFNQEPMIPEVKFRARENIQEEASGNPLKKARQHQSEESREFDPRAKRKGGWEGKIRPKEK